MRRERRERLSLRLLPGSDRSTDDGQFAYFTRRRATGKGERGRVTLVCPATGLFALHATVWYLFGGLGDRRWERGRFGAINAQLGPNEKEK